MELKQSRPTQVVLLHSNDVHSRLEQSARMASYISEERRLRGDDGLLVVDCGDHMDRMRLETEGSDGRINVELLNSAGYEAATIGNNEGLTYSKELLQNVYRKYARFPVICANLYDCETGELPEWLLPRLIVHKGGLRIGLTAATAQYEAFYKLLGWEVREPFALLAEQIAWLRPHVDVTVVLSHLGLPMDERMAAQIPGIDLILGAHTHHLLEEGLVVGETTICAAGKYGDYIGRVEIGLDPESGKALCHARCVPMAAYSEDPEAAAIISEFGESGKQRLSRVVTRLNSALPAYADRESPLGNLLAAGLRRHTGAEIGLVNTGQLLGGLAAGDVTAGQLHALCPSPVNPCRMRLGGRQIRIALEQSVLAEWIDYPLRGFGFRGLTLGTLAVDGLDIVYDPNRPEHNKLVSIIVNGEPLDDERTYTVGTIDMFSFGAGYKSIKEGTELTYYLPEFIRDLLADELNNKAAVEGCKNRHWNVVMRRS
ncbi:bifunctional metallophosphatase/5'-nucleotidase [Paenibacillaceae bacterium]|nr:bifunctional metallophosphatase/5'-nucleotidase [Paenibacillaceae bacterium]